MRRSKRPLQAVASAAQSFSTILATCDSSAFGKLATVSVKINDRHSFTALLDTGSSDNFINEKLISVIQPTVHPRSANVSMASSTLAKQTKGYCVSNLTVEGRDYEDVELSILPDLCTDLILGMPFLKRHQDVRLTFGGKEPRLEICGMTRMKVETPKLFSNLSADCHPIATKSRRFNPPDEKFIEDEIQRLLNEDVIEPSHSPWRAQLVIAHHGQKKRLVVDFSQTINRFTEMDAYPLPNISDLINRIGKNKIFSVIDLSSAYYQVEIDPSERPKALHGSSQGRRTNHQ